MDKKVYELKFEVAKKQGVLFSNKDVEIEDKNILTVTSPNPLNMFKGPVARLGFYTGYIDNSGYKITSDITRVSDEGKVKDALEFMSNELAFKPAECFIITWYNFTYNQKEELNKMFNNIYSIFSSLLETKSDACYIYMCIDDLDEDILKTIKTFVSDCTYTVDARNNAIIWHL